MPYQSIDLKKVKTYPLPKRKNRISQENLVFPGHEVPAHDNPELVEVSQRIYKARQSGRPVVFMFGGHIVKRGLSPLLIDLMKRGVITHLASNGAATIHDFEIALQGQTSEDVATSLENGSFGMAEDTGAFMNRAIRQGAQNGLGIGEALGKYIAESDKFEFREYSLLYNAYSLKIPYTVHIAIGTDIIHQHPQVDFAALGWASGQDFKIYTHTISQLEGGVFCNFGSAVIGPEVFLKALSIVRNLDYNVRIFTTANFDLIPLEDYRKPIRDDQPEYYYRPRKNIVNRPVSLGGKGFHITGDFSVTVPNLYNLIIDSLAKSNSAGFIRRIDYRTEDGPVLLEQMTRETPKASAVLNQAIMDTPELKDLLTPMIKTFRIIANSYKTGGQLFLAGNGGSMSDALHISGELMKSFKLQRPLPEIDQERLAKLSQEDIACHLQQGLRTTVLGINPALRSAINNDISFPNIDIAQELYALARPGDVFLGISTSGNAKNIIYAAQVSQLKGLPVIILTGENGSSLARIADVTLKAPSNDTALAQEWHIKIYHILCEMLENHFFDE